MDIRSCFKSPTTNFLRGEGRTRVELLTFVNRLVYYAIFTSIPIAIFTNTQLYSNANSTFFTMIDLSGECAKRLNTRGIPPPHSR